MTIAVIVCCFLILLAVSINYWYVRRFCASMEARMYRLNQRLSDLEIKSDCPRAVGVTRNRRWSWRGYEIARVSVDETHDVIP